MKIENINFSYKKNKIIKDVSLDLDLNKKCVAIIGHNGAGKTTLLNIICGILKVDQKIIKPKTVFLPYDNPIYEDFSVKDNLKVWYQIFQNKIFDFKDDEIKNLVLVFKLEDLLNYKVRDLSTGQKKKVSLACIMFSNSELFVLDEPFAALDPIAVNELCELINYYKMMNRSFIITSHQLDLVEKISDQILIMKDGRIMFDTDKDDVIGTLFDTYVKIYES